jgi:olefin beta-lactone synthetase
MSDARATILDAPARRLNVADRLSEMAATHPTTIAVACPRRFSSGDRSETRGFSHAKYATITFAELDDDATRLARGLVDWGVQPGMRLVLLVRPGIEFVTLVFALLRAAAVTVLVDPGPGRRNLVRCLAEVKPDGFVAVPAAHAVRTLLPHKFADAKWNVTVGRRWFWGGLTFDQLRERGERAANVGLPTTHADDPAAIIFTSGSTGPAKGVIYTQRMFDTQVTEIQSAYGIEPGGVDLACFPLFALFNSAMGVTTVLPDMDFSRPAAADPKKLLAAANDWQVTQAFASPAVWRVVSEYGAQTGERIESLRQVFSCGAPVTADVLRATLACVAADARMHTPYGATECLPVATIDAQEVLGETAARTEEGAGVCVGRKFDSIKWRVIRISDEPIATIDQGEELPVGEIGELVVSGPQASPRYVTRTECNEEAKMSVSSDHSAIRNPQSSFGPWHRMGDVGWLDERGRFWYCGRKSQRVETEHGPLFTECVEAVFNRHPDVAKTALVGLGARGKQIPCIFFEVNPEVRRSEAEIAAELADLGRGFDHTRAIEYFVRYRRIPVDLRHNAKICREDLADWAYDIDLNDLTRVAARS